MFDRIYSAAMAKIEKGGLAARLFHWAYSTKAARLKQNVRHDKVRAFTTPCACMYYTWITPDQDRTAHKDAWQGSDALRGFLLSSYHLPILLLAVSAALERLDATKGFACFCVLIGRG